MEIRAKSLRTLSRIKNLVEQNKSIRFVHSVKDMSEQLAKKIGFDVPLEAGSYITPKVIGKVSKFNALGKEVIRKDLPKENYSYMSFRTTYDWHRNPHQSLQTITIKRYPRDEVYPPSVQLTVVDINGELYISSDIITLSSMDEDSVLHICNLMLEIFGSFKVVDIASQSVLGVKKKNLNWELLPKGDSPWTPSDVKRFISDRCKDLKPSERDAIIHRTNYIMAKKPDFIASGKAGFNGYFVYGFEASSVFILESVQFGNATYVLSEDWEEISKLTKSEIINGDVTHARVIHDHSWNKKLSIAIDNLKSTR